MRVKLVTILIMRSRVSGACGSSERTRKLGRGWDGLRPAHSDSIHVACNSLDRADFRICASSTTQLSYKFNSFKLN